MKEYKKKTGIAKSIIELGSKMGKHRQKLIELLFDEYVKSLNAVYAESQSIFICPICMRPFNRKAINDKKVSIEHIPPKAIRSSVKTITCTECNNNIGAKLQSHMNNYVREKELLAGRVLEPIPAIVEMNGHKFDTRITENKGMGKWTGVSRVSQLPPDMQIGNLAKHVGKQAVISLKIPWSKDIVDAAYLHSAYLALFSLLGYPYIMQPFLEPIRKKINDYSIKADISHRLLTPKLLASKFFLDPRDRGVEIALIWKNLDVSCLGAIIAGEMVIMPFINEHYKDIYLEFSAYLSNLDKGIKKKLPFGITPLEIEPNSKYYVSYTFEKGKELDGMKSLKLVSLK